MNSATVLLILLWPFLLLLALTNAIPVQQLKAPVGRPFTFTTAEGHAIDAEMLPRWCRYNTTGRLIFGIPQLADVGFHLIAIHDAHIEVEVAEEEEELCGPESSTTWLEVSGNSWRQLGRLAIEEQFRTIKTLLGTLKEVSPRLADVRLLPRAYLKRYRTVTETIHQLDADDEEESSPKADEQMVFLLNISCGELTEQASETISIVAENGMPFQVVEGQLRKDRPALPKTTTSTTTTPSSVRTTRRVHNNRPIVLNPLKTFTCVRGQLCRRRFDENTFKDPEDGETSRLVLSVHATGNHSNFLVLVPGGANMLEGVPMDEGVDAYSFRLEARDRQNAANSAPFQVLVKQPAAEGKSTHRFLMILDTPLERFRERPELVRDFVYRLSAALLRLPASTSADRPSAEWAEAAAQIQLSPLQDNGAGQTLLGWWNASLSRAHCDEHRINGTRDRMVHLGTERVRNEFVKQMGAQFHVRKISTELLGKCATQHLLDSARIRVWTTTQRNPMLQERQYPDSAWANQLLIPIILLATILLLCTVLTLLCCAHQKRGKKGGKRSGFTTKGLPVVFPDEVPHRDESSSADGSLATVTTPMLVEREQPPLDPSKMTMHENPLYRPPPQMQAQLVRSPPPSHHQLSTSPGRQFGQQQQSPPLGTSTFSPPGTAGAGGPMKAIDASPSPLRANPFLRDHPNQQSVRIHATPVGQRLPPPYVAH